jgi:uncharacterized ion transporter superfamily protein YfcC
MKKEVEKTVKKSNTTKKSCVGKWVNLCALLVGIVILIIGIFVKSISSPFRLIGALLIWGSSISYAIRSNEHVLVKSAIYTTLIAILLTWLFPYGALNGIEFADYGLKRIGFNDVPTVLYYSVYFALDKVLLLLAIAGFYGVLSTTKGYRKLVTDIAKKLEPNKFPIAIGVMLITFLLTCILSNAIVIVFFIPFILSIYSKMKLDKFTSFLTTFGGILLGMVAAPWGTDGLVWFNYYIGTTIKEGFVLRLIITGIVLVLTIVALILRARKARKVKELGAPVEDVFEVEELKERGNKVPVIIVLCLMTVLLVLGFVDWSTYFKVEAFSKFHTWLMELTIGKDVTIFAYLFGSAAKMFGAWDAATYATIILVFSAIIGLIYHIKLNDFLAAFGVGMKKMLKPIGIYIASFAMFVVMYMTPVFPAITSWLLGLSQHFNPYLTGISAFITSIFHADLGYTGYTVGQYLITAYADHVSVAHTVYYTMYGMTQLILPTSGILALGLVVTKVDYKDWLKYIWKIALIILVALIIVFSIATYA